MRAWDAVIAIGLGLLLALFLFPASNFIVAGWMILLWVWGLLWIRSVWPAASWVEPLGILPAYVSVAAFWVALVLQIRRLVGLAEGSETSTKFGEWSVRLSCTVFGFASFVAWRVHAFVFNLGLAAMSVDPFGVPLLAPLFTWQLFMVTTVLGLAIAVPNYGHLPVMGMRRLIHSVSGWWSTRRDQRLLGKEFKTHGAGVKPRRRETGRSFRSPSNILPAYSTHGSSASYPIPLPTPQFSADYWLPSRGQFPGSVTGMSQPMVADDYGECIVCGKSLSAAAQVLRCPHCSARAHQEHFLKWLRDNAHCPRCRKPLTPYDLVDG